MNETLLVTARLLGAPAEQAFLEKCNGRRRVRIFSSADYASFCTAVVKATEKVGAQQPFYEEGNAGNNGAWNRFPVPTSRWAVWVETGWRVEMEYRKVMAFENKIPNARAGGEKVYLRDMQKFIEDTQTNLQKE